MDASPLFPPIPELLKRQYLERRTADAARLNDAIDSSDFMSVERIGHQIKGNAATFGFQDLEAIGRELEKCGKSCEPEGARAAIRSLLDWLRSAQ